jgi:hypothetical protein
VVALEDGKHAAWSAEVKTFWVVRELGEQRLRLPAVLAYRPFNAWKSKRKTT